MKRSCNEAWWAFLFKKRVKRSLQRRRGEVCSKHKAIKKQKKFEDVRISSLNFILFHSYRWDKGLHNAFFLALCGVHILLQPLFSGWAENSSDRSICPPGTNGIPKAYIGWRAVNFVQTQGMLKSRNSFYNKFLLFSFHCSIAIMKTALIYISLPCAVRAFCRTHYFNRRYVFICNNRRFRLCKQITWCWKNRINRGVKHL